MGIEKIKNEMAYESGRQADLWRETSGQIDAD